MNHTQPLAHKPNLLPILGNLLTLLRHNLLIELSQRQMRMELIPFTLAMRQDVDYLFVDGLEGLGVLGAGVQEDCSVGEEVGGGEADLELFEGLELLLQGFVGLVE